MTQFLGFSDGTEVDILGKTVNSGTLSTICNHHVHVPYCFLSRGRGEGSHPELKVKEEYLFLADIVSFLSLLPIPSSDLFWSFPFFLTSRSDRGFYIKSHVHKLNYLLDVTKFFYPRTVPALSNSLRFGRRIQTVGGGWIWYWPKSTRGHSHRTTSTVFLFVRSRDTIVLKKGKKKKLNTVFDSFCQCINTQGQNKPETFERSWPQDDSLPLWRFRHRPSLCHLSSDLFRHSSLLPPTYYYFPLCANDFPN